jgi:hypothetical protein
MHQKSLAISNDFFADQNFCPKMALKVDLGNFVAIKFGRFFTTVFYLSRPNREHFRHILKGGN